MSEIRELIEFYEKQLKDINNRKFTLEYPTGGKTFFGIKKDFISELLIKFEKVNKLIGANDENST